jgi:uncharacterized membrane protein HdeD (DUF308 family)
VLLRGLMAVAFGVLAFAWPGVTIPRLVLLFGLYAIAHGVLSAAAAIGNRGQHGSLLLAIEAIVGIWAGVMTLRTSAATPMAFVLLVWLWAIGTGILRIAEAIRLRKDIPGDVWLALSGVVTVLFGFMLLSHIFVGVIGLAFLIAAFAVICGIFEILLGWELRALRRARA